MHQRATDSRGLSRVRKPVRAPGLTLPLRLESRDRPRAQGRVLGLPRRARPRPSPAKGDTQTARGRMDRCATSRVIREKQIPRAMSCRLPPSCLPAGPSVQRRRRASLGGPSCGAGRALMGRWCDEPWGSQYGTKAWSFLKKTKNTTATRSSNPTSHCLLRENENTNLKRRVHPCAGRSVSHSGRETASVPGSKQRATHAGGPCTGI